MFRVRSNRDNVCSRSDMAGRGAYARSGHVSGGLAAGIVVFAARVAAAAAVAVVDGVVVSVADDEVAGLGVEAFHWSSGVDRDLAVAVADCVRMG